MNLQNDEQQQNLQDKILSQFYYVCSNRRPNLEQWIDQSQLRVNASISRDSPTYPGYAPLHLAVSCKNLQAVEALLRRNADLGLENARGQTPVHLCLRTIQTASRRGRKCTSSEKTRKLESILEKMLAEAWRGSYVNAREASTGLTHFHAACYKAKEAIVAGYLESGGGNVADVVNRPMRFDSPYWPGWTPLHVAARYCLLNVAGLLLRHGADVGAKNARGQTPLHCAIRQGNRRLIEMLFVALNQNCQSVNPADNVGLSLLHVDCMIGDEPDSLDRFLQQPANNQQQAVVDLNLQVERDLWAGWTPLHVAAHLRNIYFMRLLIQNGADANARDANDLSPLQLAVQKRIVNMLFFDLLLSQYNKQARRRVLVDGYRDDAYRLYAACMCSHKDAIRELLDKNEGRCLNAAVPEEYPFDLPGYTPLHFAVERGVLETIQLLLEYGADSCLQDATWSMSPLHLAARRKNFEAARLIAMFTDPRRNPRDSRGLTHLHVVCMLDETEIAERLLDNADNQIDAKTKSGDTPLHVAVKSGSKRIVRLLLKRRADFTIQNSQGQTALHLAVAANDEETCQLVLSSYNDDDYYSALTDPNPSDARGLSHFHVACMKNKHDLVARFLEHDKVNVASSMQVKLDADEYAGFTPLHFAVKYQSLETIAILLRHSAAADTMSFKDACDKTPLHYACDSSTQYTSKKILDLFWSSIDDDLDVDRLGLTAVHVACMRDDSAMVQQLLTLQPAAVNEATSSAYPRWPGYSPLHFAAKHGSIGTIQKLLDAGAEVDASDKYGFRPLHLACSRSKAKVVRKLLEAGADPTAKSHKHVTPLRLAVQVNSDEIVRMILSHPRSRSVNPMDNKGLTYFHVACLRNMCDVVEEYLTNRNDNNKLAAPLDVNQTAHPLALKYPGYTALHMAVERCSGSGGRLVGLLLRHGANVDIDDGQGRTPLHLLFEPRLRRNAAAAFELLVRGAAPDARSALGDTCLEFAIKHNQWTIFQLALGHGANPNLVNPVLEQRRPLQLAIESCRVAMIEALLNSGAEATIKLADGSNLVHWTVSNVPVSVHSATTGNTLILSKIFILLLEHGCDLNAIDAAGRSPLHRTYWPTNYSALEALLKCGADINTEDRSGRTVVSFLFEIASSRIDRPYLYKILLRHLELRRLAGPRLSPTNEALYDTLLEASEVFQESGEEAYYEVDDDYARELNSMRDVYFGGYVTLWKLYKDNNAMARHLARSGGFKAYVRSGQVQQNFPLSSCLIMMRYARALAREKLLGPAVEALAQLLKENVEWINWNDEMSDALIDYLDDQDLKNLTEAYGCCEHF
ncbi:serine/threonine-protein phosphatase 6 regulatory ankyrin repeat subunit A-like [Trichogramma pretiosum]|uniref:serine/threonine-protein phosphatase 6 regulatory ankyrin repeat subunit A-like n=1 Tax=Trichogramma pretiosum TaxID=7493 RepID=UPI0006C9902A|nr:serine/threonine-protein phosphatase 6 regulatory ankyrin repeat subunit A-like [Trichogramma pretiosum]